MSIAPTPETAGEAPATKLTQGSFIFIFLTVTLDMLSVGLLVPILPSLVNEMTGGNIKDAAYYVGIFSLLWALMQFVFMPILGALSDQIGRKPVLLISNFGQAFAHVLTALSPGLFLLGISRLLMGASSAVVSTASAYIADTVEPDGRAQKFGMLGAAFGLGFILGPAVGGYLGKIDLHLPFWVAAGLTFANGLYCLFFVKESLPQKDRSPFTWTKANPLKSIGFLGENAKVMRLAIVKGLADFSHVVYGSVFVLYGLYRYGWKPDVAGLTLGVVGILAMVVQVGLVGRTIKALGEVRTMILGLFCGALGFVLYGLAPSAIWFWAALPIGALSGFLAPAIMGLLSREIGPHEQGRLQGALGSVQAGAAILGPLIFTGIFAWSVAPERAVELPGAAFLLAAAFTFAGCVLAGLSIKKLTMPLVQKEAALDADR
jgi:MFS transporter, DHA1 family, tetracycline resistance protein